MVEWGKQAGDFVVALWKGVFADREKAIMERTKVKQIETAKSTLEADKQAWLESHVRLDATLTILHEDYEKDARFTLTLTLDGSKAAYDVLNFLSGHVIVKFNSNDEWTREFNLPTSAVMGGNGDLSFKVSGTLSIDEVVWLKSKKIPRLEVLEAKINTDKKSFVFDTQPATLTSR